MTAPPHTSVREWGYVVCFALAPACVGVPALPEVPSAHPASLQAVESPRPDISSVLGGASTPQAVPATEATPEMKSGHGGHEE